MRRTRPPESIRKLKDRGEVVMADKVRHLIQREVALSARIIFLRDTDGKETREQAWQVFKELHPDIVVGLPKNSIEAWILVCWPDAEATMRDVSAWMKQHRGSAFNPFREPDRLTPNLGKSLLAHLDCDANEDYVRVIVQAEDDGFFTAAAQRVGFADFVNQLRMLNIAKGEN